MASFWAKLKSMTGQLTEASTKNEQNEKHSRNVSPSQCTEFEEEDQEPRIRDIPVVDSKYKHIWQRAFSTIKARNILAWFLGEIRLYGTDEAEAYDLVDEVKDESKQKMMRKRTVAIEDEFDSQEEEPPTGCLFHPSGNFNGIWNIVLVLILLYTAIVMPYRLAFAEFVWFDEWFYIELCVDALFFTDFLVNLNTAIYEDRQLIVSRKVIFLTYLRGWFFLDILAWIPFNLIESGISGEQNSQSRYNTMVRLVRLPRLYRIMKFAKLIKVLRLSNSPVLLELQSYLQVRQSRIRIVSYSFTVMIATHIIAWLWYFCAKIEGFGPDTWVVQAGLQDDSNADKYIASIYWVFATLSTVGYGDLSAGTEIEMLWAIWVMLFGVWFFSFIIGSLSSTFARINASESRLMEKMKQLDEFTKDAGLEKDLQVRLRHAVKYSSEKTGFSWDEWREVFNELPKKLKYEVAMVMHQGAANDIPFFRGRDIVFISTVVPFLMPQFFQAESSVYYKKEHADEIYFVVKGRVVFVHEEIVFVSQPKGSYFGEIEVLKQVPRKFDVAAFIDCNLLILKRELVLVILENFFSIGQELKDVATMRNRLYKKARVKAIETNQEKQNSHFGSKQIRRLDTQQPAKKMTSLPEVLTMLDKSLEAVMKIDEKIDAKIAKNDKKIQRIQNSLWDASELVDQTSAGVPIIRPPGHNQIKLPPLRSLPNIIPAVIESNSSDEKEEVPTFRAPNPQPEKELEESLSPTPNLLETERSYEMRNNEKFR